MSESKNRPLLVEKAVFFPAGSGLRGTRKVDERKGFSNSGICVTIPEIPS